MLVGHVRPVTLHPKGVLTCTVFGVSVPSWFMSRDSQISESQQLLPNRRQSVQTNSEVANEPQQTQWHSARLGIRRGPAIPPFR